MAGALLSGGAAAAGAAADALDPGYRILVPRLHTAPVIDGRADEPAWSDAARLTDFVQLEPHGGEPSLERTEVRIGYDAKALYVAFRCFTADPTTIVGAVMSRDAQLDGEDHVEIAIDTFLDHQNAYLFETNPRGARVDGTIRDDGEDVRFDWDGIWSVAASRDAGGWTAEFAIPFSTLRFPQTDRPVFGINFGRFIAPKVELSYWKPLRYDRGLKASRYRVSSFGEVSGFSEIERGNLFTFRPHALLGGERQAHQSVAPIREGGLDLRVPFTSSASLDVTLNPNFANAEADEQKLNLTRFPLLLPEKRDFFKEAAGLFYFGDRIADASEQTFEQFKFFQSRQIGLAQDGQVSIPVTGGARLAGQVGGLGVGLLNLTTADVHDPVRRIDAPRENFTILRLKQQFRDNSTIGVMGINKQGGDGSYNRGFGADFNWVANDSLRFGGFLARTLSPGMAGDDRAGSVDVLLQTRHLGLRGLYSDFGAHFNPEVGYLTRPAIRKVQLVPTFTFSAPSFGINHAILYYDFNYVLNRSGDLLTRLQKPEVEVIFTNGFSAALIPTIDFEHIDVPFNIYPNVTIPPGSYNFKSLFFGLASDLSEPLGLVVWLDTGQFWGGHRLRTRFDAYAHPLPGLVFHGVYDRQAVNLPWGKFVSRIGSAQLTYSFSTTLSTRALVQYASDDSVRVNVLLDWEYVPGSNAYLIFNDERDLLGGRPWLDDASVALKFVFSWGVRSRRQPAGKAQATLAPHLTPRCTGGGLPGRDALASHDRTFVLDRCLD